MTYYDELTKSIHNILYYEWDPIGVAGDAPEVEYDSYIVQLMALVRTNSSSQEIAEDLVNIEQRMMGLPGNAPRAIHIAEKLKALYRPEYR